jgi:superfamily II DNA or RNA helicase
MDRGKVPLVIVPSELLQSQWAAELNHHLDNLSPRILRCGAGFDTWRSSNLLGPWSRPISNSDGRIILATVQTASRSDFLQRVRQGDHLFLVGDEVHRLGSGMHRNVLSIETGPRLGLSATPVRYGDQEGTKAIFDYFGPVIPPPYTVADAVKAGTLTPYFYFVRLVPLTEEEQERWDQASRDIGIFFARYKGVMHQSPEIQARFNQLLIARARIIKGASRKIDTAVQTLLEEFKAGQRWLVYCEDQVQLNRMLVALRREGLPASEYHSAMVGDKERTLTDLRINGGIVVSIRCLDEGVDIPSVSHALIMASSKNPREFIQRRGRVLRRSEGKTFSNIFDLLAVPTTIDQSEGSNSFVAGEIARAAEFATNASNPSATLEVRRVATRFNIDIEHLVQAGLEDDIDD